jgi:PGAP1-like protein
MSFFLFLRILLVISYDYKIILLNFNRSGKACVFVHGHRGHYSQGNALGYVLDGLCDVYSLDFKEDISGISHEVLYKQAEFISIIIQKLYNEYGSEVTLIGHSMGGIAAVLSAISVATKISVLVTLNSPLAASPLNTYLAFPWIYRSIHNFLKTTNLRFVSITGGVDSTVPAALTKLPIPGLTHLYTTQMPGVYKQLGHENILTSRCFLASFYNFLASGRLEDSEIHNWLAEETLEQYQEYYPNVLGTLNIGNNSVDTYGWYEIQFIHDGDVIISTSSEIIQLKRRESVLKVSSIKISFWYLYRISVFNFDTYCFLVPPAEISLGYASLDTSLSLYKIMYSRPVFLVDKVLNIKPGKLMRYPLTVELDKEALWIYYKCKSEEIIQRNSKHLTLFNNEICWEGPDIWIISDNSTGTLTISLLDFLRVFLVEFRLNIISSGLCLFLASDTDFIITSGIVLWLTHDWLRFYGLIGLDNIDFQVKYMSLLETALTLAFGYLFSIGFNILYKGFKKFVEVVPEIEVYRHFIYLIALVYFFPWPVFDMVIVFLAKSSQINNKKIFRLVFVSFMLNLPQKISWYWRLATFGHSGVLNSYDFFSILSPIIFLISEIYSSSVVHSLSFNMVALYFLLCTQDLLYRANLVINLYLCCLSFIKLFKVTKLRLL